VDGLTARQIRSATGVNVAAGSLVQGTPYTVTYIHATTEFILQNFIPVTITGLSAETALATNDEIPVYDVTETANNKVTVANLFKAVSVLTQETAVDAADQVLITDTSDSDAANRASVTDFLESINTLTEDTTPDVSADFLLTYDTSASTVKKAKPSNLSTSGLVLISSQTASSSATIDFTGLDDTYEAYEIRLSNVKPATDQVELRMRVGTGAGPTYQSGASDYYWQTETMSGGVSAIQGDTADTEMVLTFAAGASALGNASGEALNGVVLFGNPAAADLHAFGWNGAYRDSAGVPRPFNGGGGYETAEAITAIRFLMSSGNIASGLFSLYGFKK
jgi:hypothetical protein